jgi:integrase
MPSPILNDDFEPETLDMAKSNTPNERIKRAYIDFLRQAMGRSEDSLEAVAAALSRFENYTGFRDFKDFRVEQAKGFKAHLAQERNSRTGGQLSAATIHSTLGALKAFFRWLSGQPGYKSRIDASDAEYFNPMANQARIATAHREQRGPSIEQIRHVLNAMPAGTDIEKRARAVIAFTILTGARDGATASFKLKHIDVVAGKVDQDAREVATKRAKTFSTYFFPVGDDMQAIVVDWVDFLRRDKLWGDDDPLFPATENGIDKTGRFGPVGLARRHWRNATPIRRIFNEAFSRAGLPYANPHSFRNTLVQLAYQLRLSPEQFKVWSQNLGHESILTTFSSYGPVTPYRQGEIMRRIEQTGGAANDADDILCQISALLTHRKG